MSTSDQALVRKAVADGEAQSLGQIMPALRRAAPGKILDISFDQRGGGFIYMFTILTDTGRYLDVSIDAKTGAALSIKGR